ncbi:uncharacterized protein LOC107487520 [Arachis duranensis]|uniref:Uncharacterized protein LOC107487520 n=1 Tax=Arachis duranensis TaxID=130453 RepID=A0A6P5NRM3_ARADU|nr:uncharacterized protein LOC107487520 [Arachis duranensis]
MGRKHDEKSTILYNRLILLVVSFASCGFVYFFLSAVLTKNSSISLSASSSLALVGEGGGGGCCRGIENLELWGAAVKWGSDFKFNSSEDCCNACKSMCTGNDGTCLCDTWVFCGNREACGSKFGECWLKKQKDSLAPEKQDGGPPGEENYWISGLIFGKGEGIIAMETEFGTLHMKLFPDCAPHSVAYILELLALRHCAGCQFYRAESRGESWDSEGNHIKNVSIFPSNA